MVAESDPIFNVSKENKKVNNPNNTIKEMDLIPTDSAGLGNSPSAKSTETSPSTSILQSAQYNVNENNPVKKDVPKGKPNKATNKLERLYQSTVDSQYTIGKAIKGVDQTAERNAKILASHSRNAAGMVDYSIKNGSVDMGGKQVTKTSLQQIFDSVPDIDAFNGYAFDVHYPVCP